jgi:peptidyl-prolyl cis-trans isomerase D
MLQDIRQQAQGTAAKVIIGLIVISFAFFGIESILVGGGGNEVAEVNGQQISPQELQQALDTQKRRLMAMMGEQLDPAMLDDERLAPQAMEALINRKLLMQAAEEMKLAVSEREIGAVVSGMEQFQIDGAFSPDVYKSVLASAGYTPSYFKQTLVEDMLLTQLRSGISGSEFVTPSEIQLNTNVILEQRDLQFFTIPLERFTSATPPTEDQINAYYADNQERFRTPESVDIDYLELSLDDFLQPVEESALLAAYEQAKHENQYQTQNRVSHILFENEGKSDVDERVKLVQEKLSAGSTFAELAKEFSDDIGSADRGGDLGFTSGDTFPKEMEVVVAGLKPGVISDPVQTDAGTHLIVVTERKKGEAPSFEEMRQQLESDIQTDEARVELLRTVEALRDLSFNSEDLGYPAKELNLQVKRADAVERSQNEGLFSSPELLKAVFSDDVLSSGHNSEVIELADSKFVVLRVRKHNMPEVEALEVVRDKVVASLVEEHARSAVSVEASRALQQLRSGHAIAEYVDSHNYELEVELGIDRRNSSIPPEVLRRTFELPPPADGAVSDFIMMPNGDAVVIELLSVTDGDFNSLPEQEQVQFQQFLSAESGALVNTEFQRGLRERADITVL